MLEAHKGGREGSPGQGNLSSDIFIAQSLLMFFKMVVDQLTNVMQQTQTQKQKLSLPPLECLGSGTLKETILQLGSWGWMH